MAAGLALFWPNVRYTLGAVRRAELERYPAGWRGLGTRVVRVPYTEGTLVIDLRASQATNDFAMAAEFAKRFCPKGKPIFTLRKPAARQDRVFNSDRDPAFRGLIMVLTDGDTAGSAEALADALRFYDKALIMGQPTA